MKKTARRSREKPARSDDRARLLAAAPKLAARVPLKKLTIRSVCAAARCTPAAFRRHFAGLDAYLESAQQAMMDRIRDRILGQMDVRTPGFERLRAGSESYLDDCLAMQPLRGWFIEARRAKPALTESLRRQNHVYALLLTGEFRTLGWPHPGPAARLYLAMLMEAGLVEFQAGKPVPDVRETLWDFLGTYG